MDIQINKLTKSFGNKIVIRDFSALIREKRVTCIMGPSGCGKTTLLNILMGLLLPDSGTITGVPRKKSAVFQEERLCESFSAVANVRMVCQKEISTRMIEEHLAGIGLKDSMYMPVSELSGGMRRRVAIVRAMLAKSEIIFLDEPFKGLDAETKQSVIRYVKVNTRDKTVIMVTHDLDEVQKMDGRLISMELEEKK
jgi:NitT/TauT family transport system ATP-binding protein